MAQQKIADFFAQIGIKVDQKQLSKFEKSVTDIGRALHNMEVSAKKTSSKVSNSLAQFAKAENKLTREIDKGNKALQRRANIRGRLKSQSMGGDRLKGRGYVWGDLSHLDSVKSVSASARRAQQSMYDKLFGAVDTSAADKERASIDKLHSQALREDSRRRRAAENLARIQANAEKRVQEMAQRTAAIREAGARRAAAIIQAAEIKAQAAARRVSGGGSGGSGRGFNVMGGATVGGALGSATSSLSGLLPGIGGGWAMMNLNRINQEINANRLAMTAVMGNEQAGGQQSDWLKNLANTVGFDYRQTMPAFTKMMASGKTAGLSTGSVQSIFQGVTEYGRVMGLDTEAMKGSMRALEQMLNKGQVMSEELKGQLAERMPGVISAMTEAAGFKTPAELFKAMEDGQVKSTEVLEKFSEILAERARQGGALEKAMQSTAAQQARFNNEFTEFVDLMGRSGMDSAFAKIFKSFADFLKNTPELATGLANAMGKLATGVEWAGESLTNVIKALDDLGDSMGIGGTNLALLSGLALMLSTSFGRVAAAGYAVFLIIEDIALGLKGANSYTKDFLDFLDANAWAEVGIKAFAFALAVGLIAKNVQSLAIAMGLLSAAGVGGAAGKGGKLAGLGGVLGLARSHPMLTGLVLAGAGTYAAYERYHNDTSPKAMSEKEQIDLRLRNLQRGPGAGQLTEMTNKYSLPGVNTPSTNIENINIEVSGAADPEKTAELVINKFREMIKPTNFPVTK